MNKKADAEGITLTFSVLFLILILFLFWIFSFIDRGTIRKETSEQMEIANININLLSLLRTEIDGKEISNLIAESYPSNDYSKIDAEINFIFQNYFDRKYCWSLIILENNIEIHKINSICKGNELSSQANLPTLNSKEIAIKLIKYELIKEYKHKQAGME